MRLDIADGRTLRAIRQRVRGGVTTHKLDRYHREDDMTKPEQSAPQERSARKPRYRPKDNRKKFLGSPGELQAIVLQETTRILEEGAKINTLTALPALRQAGVNASNRRIAEAFTALLRAGTLRSVQVPGARGARCLAVGSVPTSPPSPVATSPRAAPRPRPEPARAALVLRLSDDALEAIVRAVIAHLERRGLVIAA